MIVDNGSVRKRIAGKNMFIVLEMHTPTYCSICFSRISVQRAGKFASIATSLERFTFRANPDYDLGFCTCKDIFQWGGPYAGDVYYAAAGACEALKEHAAVTECNVYCL